MDDVTELVITPFRDIVEKGRAAISNAGDTEPMLKAAQTLVKEGERALKKIEPLCKKQFDEYGPSFLAALRDNEEIAHYRLLLTDCLWEFDDYLEIDEFDAEKFAELQALSRSSAPKIYDILLKMKLETPAAFDSRNFLSQLSPPSSPRPPQTMPLSATSSSGALSTGHRGHDSISSSPIDNRSNGEILTAESVSENLGYLIDQALDQEHAFDPPPQPSEQLPPPPGPPPTDEPPRPPSANPWDTKLASVKGGNEQETDTTPVNRRPPVEPALDSFPDLTSTQYATRNHSLSNTILSGSSVRGSGFVQDYTFDHDDRPMSLSSQISSYSMSPTQTSARPRATSNSTPTIPEEGYGNRVKRTESRPKQAPTYSTMPYRTQQRPHQSSIHSNSELQHQENQETSSPQLLGNSGQHLEVDRRPSIAESLIDPNPLPFSSTSYSHHRAQPGLELAPDSTVIPQGYVDHGLIPVDPATTPPITPKPQAKSQSNLPQRNASIENTSSFHIHKGFCDGAKEVINGGIGVKKTKKPGFSSTATVARCTHCLYELDFRNIELDVNKQDDGNYTKHGVGYRLRFLQKSHLPAKRVDDILYGCVFCINAGYTLDQSDATVFTSTNALFQHLSRHPRPLPEISGISVIDGENVPDSLYNDYDLHFRHPVQAHPVDERSENIANLPTGVAKESARRLFGQKLLPDRTPALELVQGAKIAGVTWPARYHGEWCFGWHDGVYASMPTDVLKIDAPSFSLIKQNGTSRIRAKARWRFAPKEIKGEDWLRFDKDELITNICWAYPDFWCWSGTNSKGKWGIFPQSFLDANTLTELSQAGSDRASILSSEKNKSSSVIPKFSLRSKQGRPPSIAGSTSSGDTTAKPSKFSGFRRAKGGDL